MTDHLADSQLDGSRRHLDEGSFEAFVPGCLRRRQRFDPERVAADSPARGLRNCLRRDVSGNRRAVIRIVVVFYRRAPTRTGRSPVIRYSNPYDDVQAVRLHWGFRVDSRSGRNPRQEAHSTVTLFARFRGLSMDRPSFAAVW